MLKLPLVEDKSVATLCTYCSFLRLGCLGTTGPLTLCVSKKKLADHQWWHHVSFPLPDPHTSKSITPQIAANTNMVAVLGYLSQDSRNMKDLSSYENPSDFQAPSLWNQGCRVHTGTTQKHTCLTVHSPADSWDSSACVTQPGPLCVTARLPAFFFAVLPLSQDCDKGTLHLSSFRTLF